MLKLFRFWDFILVFTDRVTFILQSLPIKMGSDSWSLNTQHYLDKISTQNHFPVTWQLNLSLLAVFMHWRVQTDLSSVKLYSLSRLFHAYLPPLLQVSLCTSCLKILYAQEKTCKGGTYLILSALFFLIHSLHSSSTLLLFPSPLFGSLHSSMRVGDRWEFPSAPPFHVP